jgi:signal transduction histidine kinase/CheY-like chemotaxis protein
MWHTLKISREAHTDFVASVRELLQSTFRNLIITTGGIYLIWYFATTSLPPEQFSLKFLPLTVLIVLTCALSLWLLTKRLLIAQAVWQAGLAVSIVWGLYLSQEPLIVFFYALLPLMAVVTVGGLAGLLAEGLVIALVLWLANIPSMPSLPLSFIFGVIIGGAFSGLLGWTSARALVTAVQWSLFGIEQAQRNMEEARRHRAQLAKVLKDLDMAYHRLERANSALLVARDAAVAAERFKAEFVANVSHELRTSLNLIIGFSEVMATAPESYGDTPLPGAYRGDIMTIYRGAQHLSDLIDDVLDLSQIEVGRMPLTKEAVRLGEVIDEATDIMRSLAEARGLQLKLDLPDELPVLRLDRTRIRQVLLNLLSNAMRFTKEGWIAVQARIEDQEVIVTVEDTGPGIAADRLKNAFEAFSQLEDGHTHEGSGLGLALSKKFVELHGGRIWIESEEECGTMVGFTLPMPKDEESVQVPARKASSSMQYQERRPSVLVLHDDARVLSSLRRHIDGYQLELAETREKARKIVQEEFPVAVIMDADWTSNWATTISDLNLPPHTPLITCPLPSPRHLGHLLGAVDYLPKPVTREDLQDLFARLSKTPQTVLIVDDDPPIIRLLARMLTAIDPALRILEAFSGKEGLEIARVHRPDIILLDVIMPDISGYTVLEKIARDEAMAGTQIVFTSARDLEQDIGPIKGELRLGYGGGFSHSGILQMLQSILVTITQLSTGPSSDVAPLKA